MRVKSLRFCVALLLSGSVLTFIVGIASVCFLRNLGWITGSLAPILGLNADTAQTLSEIFGQLRSASLSLPLEILGVLCLLFCGFAIIVLHFPNIDAKEYSKAKKVGKIVLVCVLGVILFLLLTAVTIWLTEVNDIRFDRVMVRLVSLLKSGIL